jgi:signal transduction histidine kinase
MSQAKAEDMVKKACHQHLMEHQYGLPAICWNSLLMRSAVTRIKLKFSRFARVFHHILHRSNATLSVWVKRAAGMLLSSFIFLMAGFSIPAISFAWEFGIHDAHKFSPGDDPAWSSPLYDDSRWKAISSSINKHAADPIRAGISWHRIHFTAKNNSANHQAAVFLGPVGDVDETYLNGVKIGGEGNIRDGVITATKSERLYLIPDNLLRPGDDNVLAVRVMNIYPKNQVFYIPVTIGDYSDLLVEKLKKQSATEKIEFILFTFFFIYIQFCIILYIKGMFSKEYISFGIFMLLYSAGFFLDSLTFYETGVKSSFVQRLIISLYAALPAAMLYFLWCGYHLKLNNAMRYNMIFALILSAGAFVVQGFEAERILIYVWIVSAVSSAVTALFFAISAYRQRIFESTPALVGIVWICLSGGVSLLSGTMGILRPLKIYGYCLSDFILLFWIICIKYALIARYARVKKSMDSLSGRLLSAHEEERKRLAKDLHDSMGQNLAMIKFNLQRINRTMNNRIIDDIITEISGSIAELRDITSGLMPLSLQAVGIIKTIEATAHIFSQKTGINTSLDSENLPRTSLEVELNLFRIFQEAMNNAAKHSGAANIIISLRQGLPRLIVMEITDDGHGFDYRQVHSNNSELGLSIMQERARIIGGNLTVTSTKNKGTTIRVEAPVI